MSKAKAPRQIPFIDLIGDMEENYYQLGLKDAEAAKLSLRHTESLIKTPWQSVDSSLRFLGQSLFRGSSSWNKRFSPWLKAYAEGLDIPVERYMLTCLVPELTACLAKWMPRLPKSLMGCSSLFFRDEQGDLVHLRTLDFPLGTTFDAHERILRTHFSQSPTITSYGSAGFPYSSLTACNSEGVTLALHQKFNDVFDPAGVPIFELAQDMLQRCGDLKTCLGYLRKARSLTTWSFHLGFKDGQVLEADLSGNDLHYNTYKIDDQPYLYFNNELIKPSKDQKTFPPLNFSNYNRWRHESGDRKMKKMIKDGSFKLHDVLKLWTTLETRKTHGLDVLTPSSLQVAAMVPMRAEMQLIMGEAPKTWAGQIQVERGLWGSGKRKTEVIGKIKEATVLDKVWKHLLHAQSAHDLEDNHLLHHHLQMAVRHSKGQAIEPIARLFSYIFTFLDEQHPKVLSQLMSDVLELTKAIDKSMVDHAWLLISRLERVLGLKSTVVAAQLKHPSLAKLLEVESAIPDAIFKNVIRGMIHPRIDLMDVIHVHERLDS